jgi:hypothetical protein
LVEWSFGSSVGWWPGAYFLQIHAVMTRVDSDNEVNDGSIIIIIIINNSQNNIKVNKNFPCIYSIEDPN